MMKSPIPILSIALITSALTANGKETQASEPFGALSHSRLWDSRRAEFFAGPATACFRYDSNLTSLLVLGSLQKGKGDYGSQLGTDPRNLSFQADTYTLHSTHALTGRASYSIGKTDGVMMNENADPMKIYPYITADSIGGSMTAERYLFEGGYADRKGRLFWGVSGGYQAGLYYRMVDPRPKNITGLLTVRGGIGLTFGNYGAALSGMYQRYTQSSELMFKDDAGGDKTFQMTGLGTTYNRFTGLGLKSNYNGNLFSLSAEFVPTGKEGFLLEGSFSRFSFTKLLTDLNSLPLADCWENRIGLKGGYVHGSGALRWIADAEFLFVRRHGTENIFGDATLTSYPQIDALEMYSDNRIDARIGATLDWRFRESQSLEMRLSGVYATRTEVYAYPRLENKVSEKSLRLVMQYDAAFGQGWALSLSPWGILADDLSGGLDFAVSKKIGSRISLGLTAGGYLDNPRLSDFDTPSLVSGKSAGGRAGVFVAF